MEREKSSFWKAWIQDVFMEDIFLKFRLLNQTCLWTKISFDKFRAIYMVLRGDGGIWVGLISTCLGFCRRFGSRFRFPTGGIAIRRRRWGGWCSGTSSWCCGWWICLSFSSCGFTSWLAWSFWWFRKRCSCLLQHRHNIRLGRRLKLWPKHLFIWALWHYNSDSWASFKKTHMDVTCYCQLEHL